MPQATSVNVISDSEIQVVTPAGTAGVVDVTVTNPDGGTYTFPAAFTFVTAPVQVGNQGLLSGCFVNSANTPSCSLPSGWTLVNAVSFEDSSPGLGARLENMTIECGFSHSGNCAARGAYQTGVGPNVAWNSADLIGTRDTYISFWEFDDSTGRLNVDFDVGGTIANNQITDALVRFQVGCGGHTTGNGPDIPFWWNALTERLILYIEGNSGWPNYANYGWPGGTTCLGPNAPTWGNWTQWEIRVKSNTPVSTSSTLADGRVEVYQNGVLVANVPPNMGRCSSNPSTPNSCANFTGLNDIASVSHSAQAGGIYTVIEGYSSGTTCASAPNLITIPFYENGPIGPSFPCACPNQCPPNGYVPTFNRYFDDIIVLKR